MEKKTREEIKGVQSNGSGRKYSTRQSSCVKKKKGVESDDSRKRKDAEAKDEGSASFAQIPAIRRREGRKQDNDAKRRAVTSLSSSSSSRKLQKKRAKKGDDSGEEDEKKATKDTSFSGNSPPSESRVERSNKNDDDTVLLSKSEIKLRRERRRRNDLHLSFRRLITTLAKCHPEVSRRTATDDDMASVIGERRWAHGSISESPGRAVESVDGERAALAAASTDTARLNRVDIIECAIEALDLLLVEREAARRELAEFSERLAERDQEIASLRMQLQEVPRPVDSHNQTRNGTRPMVGGVVPQSDQVSSVPAASASHPCPSLQMSSSEAPILSNPAIGPHSQLTSEREAIADVTAPIVSSRGHGINMASSGTAGAPVEPQGTMAHQLPATNNLAGSAQPSQPRFILGINSSLTVPATTSAQPQMLLVPPSLAGAATSSLVLNTATPGMGTIVVSPTANVPVANLIAGLPVTPGNNQDANATNVLTTSSVLAGATNATSTPAVRQFSRPSDQSSSAEP